jgi:hypothetical protein
MATNEIDVLGRQPLPKVTGQDERGQFESDVRELFDGDANFRRDEGGEYTDTQILDMWMGWSMRAAIANHKAPVANSAIQKPRAWLVDVVKPHPSYPFATANEDTVRSCTEGVHVITPLYASSEAGQQS